MDAIAGRLNLNEYELERNAKTGEERWRINIRWYSINLVVSGWMLKRNGLWILTPEGEAALALSPDELYRESHSKYVEWDKARKAREGAEPDTADELESAVAEEPGARLILEQAEEQARGEIEARVLELDPYEFQDFVAHLLTGMGYHVADVAKPGADGGIDIVAYRDPLGATAPRIRVSVKHRQAKMGAKDVRELDGLLRKDGDMGLVVSSGGFSPDAVRELRASRLHIEQIDLRRLIDLWIRFYDSIPEEGRRMLPLKRVHFLAPDEN